MQFFAASLGVGCEFCHSGAREADTARKSRARDMIAMVRAVNNDTFQRSRVVTCYTCHRGNARPVGMPSPASASYSAWNPDSMNGAPDPAPVPGPPPADVLRMYVQSLGGEVTLAKMTTRTVR
jgi:photosynthetic reaction center cytochrome c subunit